MHSIEALSDAEVAETAQSAKLFDDIHAGTAPLDAFLSLLHAFDWLKPNRKDRAVIATWLIGNYGDPIAIAMGQEEVAGDVTDAATFAELLAQVRDVVEGFPDRTTTLSLCATRLPVWRAWSCRPAGHPPVRRRGIPAAAGGRGARDVVGQPPCIEI